MSEFIPKYGAPTTPASDIKSDKKVDLGEAPEAPKEDKSKAEEAKKDVETKKADEELKKTEEKEAEPLTRREVQDKALKEQRASFDRTEYSAEQRQKLDSGERPVARSFSMQRQPQSQQKPNQNQQQFDRFEDTSRLSQRLQQSLEQQPSPKAYREILEEKVFKGPLRDTPLHQKLQKQTMQQQKAQAQRGQESGEPLEKAEIMQLFGMRNQTEQKERFRQVLRHELAKAKQAEAKKVVSVRYQTDSQKQKEVTKTPRTAFEAAKQQFSQKLQKAVTSKFEEILQKVLNGKKAVPELPDGVKARFATKSDSEWELFFTNAQTQGSTLANAKGQISKMIEALFRGLFKKGTDGQMMLVADLALTEEGEVAENKFSQLTISDKDLLATLQKFKPGDVIPQNLMEQLGKEFDFVKLAHLIQVVVVTDEQKQQILKQLRQGYSPESLNKLEAALLSKQQDQRRQQKQEKKEPFVWAGDQFDKKQRFSGRPKFFMIMLYSVVAITVMMIIFLIIRAAM